MVAVLVNQNITNLPVLKLDQCAEFVARLDAQRDTWLHRGPGFATFGVAAYLDILCSDAPEQRYYQRRDEWNARLSRTFAELLELVRERLEGLLHAHCRFDGSVALPGFHIFEGQGICTQDWPSMHFDLQYRHMRWPVPIRRDDAISFTLPLTVPELGAALDTWDLTEADMDRMHRLGRQTNMQILAQTKPVYQHTYQPGVMAVQLRPIMHRISAIVKAGVNDRRITLQGHGVSTESGWILYW
jgi:hypothetical protein